MQETAFLYDGALIPDSPFAKCVPPRERSESKGTNTIAHPNQRQCQKKKKKKIVSRKIQHPHSF
jgi:hypothetical protein